MNIHLNDSNLIVNYIQSVLRNNYTNSTAITNKYDYNTHSLLINYLRTPNVISVEKATDAINNLNLNYNNEMINVFGVYFRNYSNLSEIIYESKGSIRNLYLEHCMNSSYNKNSINNLLDSIGYKIEYYNFYEFPYKVIIKQNGIITNFPKYEALRTVNLNCNKYLYNLTFDTSGFTYVNDDDGSIDYSIRKDSNSDSKICVIECEPLKTYTIIMGGDSVSTYGIDIGTCLSSTKDIEIGTIVHNVKSYNVLSGNYIKYTTGSSSDLLVIRLPIGSESNSTLNVLVVNDDIDSYDKIIRNQYYIYQDYDYVKIIRGTTYKLEDGKYIQDNYGNYVKAYNESKYYAITPNTKYYKYNETTKYYIESDEGTYIRTTEVNKYYRDDKYGNYVKSDSRNLYYEIKDKSNMYYSIDDNGNYYYDNNGTYAVSNYNKFNIPILEYLTDNWVINGKFIDYITCNLVSEYSETDDISEFQKIVSNNVDITYEYSAGIYDDKLKSIITEIQENNDISYVSGYIDKDTDYIITILME